METILKLYFLFYLITKFTSTVTLEDSSHKNDYYKRVQYSVNYSFYTNVCMKISIEGLNSALHPHYDPSERILVQFSFIGNSSLPIHIHHLEKKNNNKNDIKTIPQTKVSIIFISFIQDFFPFFFPIGLTFRSIRKISWPGFFWSCCIDKITNLYSYETMNTQTWQAYIIQIYKVLTAACKNLFW